MFVEVHHLFNQRIRSILFHQSAQTLLLERKYLRYDSRLASSARTTADNMCC